MQRKSDVHMLAAPLCLHRLSCPADRHRPLPHALTGYILNEKRLPLCILTRAPVLHPAYNSVPQKPQMVADALRAVEAKLGMRPTGGQAPSTWFQELTVGGHVTT